MNKFNVNKFRVGIASYSYGLIVNRDKFIVTDDVKIWAHIYENIHSRQMDIISLAIKFELNEV